MAERYQGSGAGERCSPGPGRSGAGTIRRCPPADRPPLQRETIVEAARDLIITDGLEALSLRRLAGQLGVTAPALYAHVRDKQDLLRALAEVRVRATSSPASTPCAHLDPSTASGPTAGPTSPTPGPTPSCSG